MNIKATVQEGSHWPRTALTAALSALLAAGAVHLGQSPDAVAAPALSAEQQDRLPGSFADLVETVKPAVVNISITSEQTRSFGGLRPEFNLPDQPELEEFFRRFFNDPRGPQQRSFRRHALGSGFIVSADGYVVTNNHVIEEADEVEIILDDGTTLPAEIRGVDPKTDLALLKVETDKELPYVTFGDSESARVGDWVIAIGNPFGLGGSTTTGIISARGRNIQSGPFDDFIQVDAPINRGNSGGPLFNTRGEVIGVNTAIFSPNGGSVGIGFAIPSSLAEGIVAQLKEHGTVERGWLGVHIQTVTEELADGLGLDEPSGALVSEVVDGSPAERAGVQSGDVILTFDGKDVPEMRDLPRLVAETPAGRTVKMDVWRNGETVTLDVTIGASDDATAGIGTGDAFQKKELGLELRELDSETRSEFGIDADVNGVLVAGVEPGSPAEEQGIRPGDIIVRVGTTTVSTPAEVADAVARLRDEGRSAVLMLINRGGSERFVALTVKTG